MVIRTVREIGQLGLFDAEQINPDFENVDPNAGTVDIKLDLIESGCQSNRTARRIWWRRAS